MAPSAHPPGSKTPVVTGLGLALASLLGIGLTELSRPVQAYDLHFRQNNSAFSGEDLRRLFDGALPASYDQTFSDRQWSTWLLLDVHPARGMVAITLGLCPRLSSSSAALPVATMSFLELWPASKTQQQSLIAQMEQRYAAVMLQNRSNIRLP